MGEVSFTVEPSDVVDNKYVIVYLDQWVETKTSNEHFGRFWIDAGGHTEPCGIEIQLISDV